MKQCLFAIALTASTLLGQAPVLNGGFFFEERGAVASTGQAYQTAGLLTVDGRGTVTGTEYVKSAGTVTALAVRGTYKFDADGTGTLMLQYDVADPEAEGTTRTESANYRLVAPASGPIEILRTDSGVLAEGSLQAVTAAQAALKGSFVVSEESATQFALGIWTFDGIGNVAVRTTAKGFFDAQTLVMSGRLEPQADGSFDVRLSTTAGEENDAVTVMTYKILPAGDRFELLRLDSSVLSLAAVARAR